MYICKKGYSIETSIYDKFRQVKTSDLNRIKISSIFNSFEKQNRFKGLYNPRKV